MHHIPLAIPTHVLRLPHDTAPPPAHNPRIHLPRAPSRQRPPHWLHTRATLGESALGHLPQKHETRRVLTLPNTIPARLTVTRRMCRTEGPLIKIHCYTRSHSSVCPDSTPRICQNLWTSPLSRKICGASDIRATGIIRAALRIVGRGGLKKETPIRNLMAFRCSRSGNRRLMLSIRIT